MMIEINALNNFQQYEGSIFAYELSRYSSFGYICPGNVEKKGNWCRIHFFSREQTVLDHYLYDDDIWINVHDETKDISISNLIKGSLFMGMIAACEGDMLKTEVSFKESSSVRRWCRREI